MPTPIGPGFYLGKQRGVTLFGVDLKDAREEVFVRMVCDGLSLGVAFVRAGFKGTPQAAHKLFQLPRIQERAAAILEARRTQGVVTLSEVTDMLQRVFAGAHAAEEYSAAHNAAFSLARLYGHVTDKATLEVIRRPSRDPDAPSEQILSDWVASLPVVGASPQGSDLRPEALEGPAEPSEPSQGGLIGPIQRAPAAPLGPGPSCQPDAIEGPEATASGALKAPGPVVSRETTGPQGPGPELYAYNSAGPQLDLFNDNNSLAKSGPPGIGNGAPVGPVTGTPHGRGRSGPLEHGRGHSGPLEQNGSPFEDEGTTYPSEARTEPAKRAEYPSAEDLF
jgi:hypothetical protein